MKKNYLYAVILILMLILASCDLPFSITTSGSQDTSLSSAEKTQTVESAIQTAVALTQTGMNSAGQESSGSQSGLPQALPSATQSTDSQPVDSQSPNATPLDNTNCRLGPDSVYGVVIVAEAGEALPIDGRNNDSSWWRVQPVDADPCWLGANTVTVTGDVSGVPILSTPATPTPRPVGTSLVIAYGQTKIGELSATNKFVYWAFWGQKGDVISIYLDSVDTNPVSYIDTWLELHHPHINAIVAKQDDLAPGNFNSRIPNFTLQATGYYYIKATSFAASMGWVDSHMYGQYRLRLVK